MEERGRGAKAWAHGGVERECGAALVVDGKMSRRTSFEVGGTSFSEAFVEVLCDDDVGN